MSIVVVSSEQTICSSLPQRQVLQYVAAHVAEGFKELLNRIVDKFPSRLAFAREIGMTSSRLSRALNEGDFPFNVANCLRLAKISGESATDILRAAGKEDVADLIESLYGKDRTRLLTAPERELLDDFESLTPRARESLKILLRDLAPRKKQKRPA
jgi:hypothetical protein